MPDTSHLRIGFFTDGPPFNPDTLKEKALGGSETALVQMSRTLTRRGHDVTVFNNTDRPGVFDGTRYMPVRHFPSQAFDPGFDVFVVSRYFSFFELNFVAGLKVLWNHDTLEEPRALRRLQSRIDLSLVLSSFHRDNYLTLVPELEAMTVVTRNGVDLDLIDSSVRGRARNRNVAMYVSRPERGLKVLLEDIWPKIKAARPDMELHVCGYEVARDKLAPGLAELYARLDRIIASRPDVVALGPLTKVEYYGRLAEAVLLLYPCTFPEISCIAAIEAQACRTPLVTTSGFALAETVGPEEYKVPGRPGDGRYEDEFTARALALLDDPAGTAVIAEQARSRVEEHYTWDAIAGQWERIFRLHLARRKPA